MSQGPSERLTAEAANIAVELRDSLRALFQGDGIVDLNERRILRLATTVQRETDRADETLSVLLCGFRRNGIDGQTFRRRLREHDQDTQPDTAA